MPVTVYGRLETANRLVNDAAALAPLFGIETWQFEEAADAVASGDLDEAEYILDCIDDRVGVKDVRVPIRNAHQLIVAMQEDWP